MPAANLKFEMALVIARKIIDSGEFPELQKIAKGMLSPGYRASWGYRIEAWDNSNITQNYWPQIKARMPEILARLEKL